MKNEDKILEMYEEIKQLKGQSKNKFNRFDQLMRETMKLKRRQKLEYFYNTDGLMMFCYTRKNTFTNGSANNGAGSESGYRFIVFDSEIKEKIDGKEYDADGIVGIMAKATKYNVVSDVMAKGLI